jgi:hypothetical protein
MNEQQQNAKNDAELETNWKRILGITLKGLLEDAKTHLSRPNF